MEKLNSQEEANKFLHGLRLRIGDRVVVEIVQALQSKKPLRPFYTKKRGGPPPVCGKGTVYKIKDLYDQGTLEPYVEFLHNVDSKLFQQGKTGDVEVPTLSKEKELQEPPSETQTAIEPGQIIKSCSAPPDGISVAALVKMGVPKRDAPTLLGCWRSFHEYGVHDQCFVHRQLGEDLGNGIPHDEAVNLMSLEYYTREYGVEVTHQIAELYRLYRPWEGKANRDAFREEFRRLEEVYRAQEREVLLTAPPESSSKPLLNRILDKFRLEGRNDAGIDKHPPVRAGRQDCGSYHELGNKHIVGSHAWTNFDLYTDLLTSLEHADPMERDRIFADVEKVRNQFGNKQLDGTISDTLSAVRECFDRGMSLGVTMEFGLKKSRDVMIRAYGKRQGVERSGLTVGAKVRSVVTYGYYDRAEGGGAEGDKRVTLDVVLSASERVKVDGLYLEVCGKQFEGKEFMLVDGRMTCNVFERILRKQTVSCPVIFEIDKAFAVYTEKARVHAFVNGIDRPSEPFTIDFK